MPHRIHVVPIHDDTRAATLQRKFSSHGLPIDNVERVDVYTVDMGLDAGVLHAFADSLENPALEMALSQVVPSGNGFGWAVEIGPLPGVTDNEGRVAQESLEALVGKQDGKRVYASQLLLLSGGSKEDALRAAQTIANPLIQDIRIKSATEYSQDGGMDLVVPRVKLDGIPHADYVSLNVSDKELVVIGKKGIANDDGTRRGPLALGLDYMKAIQAHFKKLGRNPTDVELESIAQTWSEHCKHTIFANPIDTVTDGLYKTFIKGATARIREEKGEDDFCISVFKDNSGAIAFDDKFMVTHKVETHNSPSALDPYGGSITGIVGVNRDVIGFGKGAKPVANVYGFCFADPNDTSPLFKGEGFTQRMLSPLQILEGVVDGVNHGGNASGIPTAQGFVRFDPRYKGKPLVFVGTAGVMERKTNGKPSHEKKANSGDYIVMIGGKVGLDGIHGATFSSEAMDSGSPATAVQIGDPFTQKKLSDAIVKEARDLGLYSSITDNGAGGLSCSVAEMAKESGGCHVQLKAVPTKYPGMQPWQTWISESQERMTLAVPPGSVDEFLELMGSRGVEATVIGEFTDSGNCVVQYGEQTVMDLSLEFLHDGLPIRKLKTKPLLVGHDSPSNKEVSKHNSLENMLGRLNIASTEFISMQYDHEVQGGSVTKPLQGKGRVNADATVTKPVLDSPKAVVLSQGVNPSYSDIDTYSMAAAAIDTAVRNAVAAGASLDHLALLDNFCWCSSDDPVRLGQLKQAAEACYDTAIAYGTPFISGKDSMFNDFKGFDSEGNPVKISVPPTLLVSSMGVMEDATKAVTIDAKFSGDLVYVLGDTDNEMGGSEFYAMVGEETRGEAYLGGVVPFTHTSENLRTYRVLEQAIKEGVVASAQSVHIGGLGVALAKTAMAGKLGMDVCLDDLQGDHNGKSAEVMYSESQGRIVVTVAPQNRNKFEGMMGTVAYSNVGKVTSDGMFKVSFKGLEIENLSIDRMLETYKAPMRNL